MSNEIEKTQKQLTAAEKKITKGIKDLITATDGVIAQNNLVSSDSLVGELSTGNQPVVIDGVVVASPGDKKQALLDIQAADEKQRALRIQYESDRTFFEQNVLKKARGLCEIQEDYIKVLHPHFRTKFIAGVCAYGTVAAAMKYMKDNHGLVLRGDVLRRISTLIPSFKQEIDDALEEYQAVLHMELHRRAVEGTDKGVWHQGECVGTEKVYSDSLLAKMVDTHNPEYKEAKAKDAKGSGIVNVTIIKDFHSYKE